MSVTDIGNAIGTYVQEQLASQTWADNTSRYVGTGGRIRERHDGTGLHYGPGKSTDLWYPLYTPHIPGAASVVVHERNHFTPNEWIAANWTASGDGGGAVALANEVNGVLSITTNAGDGDYYQIRQAAEAWKLSASKVVIFEAKIKPSDATDSAILFGLAPSTDDIIATHVATSLADGCFFYKGDTSTDWDLVSIKNSTASTQTTATASAAAYHRFGFYCNGTTIVPYYDNVAVTAISSNLCDDEELAIHFACVSGAVATKTLYVDYYEIGMHV